MFKGYSDLCVREREKSASDKNSVQENRAALSDARPRVSGENTCT